MAQPFASNQEIADAFGISPDLLEAMKTDEDACPNCLSLQARIDELMLEYCPGEMTPDQMAEYERHQKPAWEHLLQFGYAPGGYMAWCCDCETAVYNLDKRATRCFSCADKAYKEVFND